MSRQVGITDFIILGVPDDIEEPLTEDQYDAMESLVLRNVWGQYRTKRVMPPQAVLLQKVDWKITKTVEDVEAFQPAHDCEDCRAGNVKAKEFLAANPGSRLALGNLYYVEVWPE